MMRCPSCNSFEWNSVERNIFGENILVQCRNCFTTYMTKWNPAYQPPKTVTQSMSNDPNKCPKCGKLMCEKFDDVVRCGMNLVGKPRFHWLDYSETGYP